VVSSKNKIQYLGHVISEDGVGVDPEKIQAIMDWLDPKNVYEVRSFVGLYGYYRMFIKGFSKIDHPITSLQRRGVKFVWSVNCEASFQELKYVLTNDPVLKVADLEKYFLVCTNACNEGIGEVLMHEGHMICYESRKLNEHGKHYVTHDLELATIVHAL
jgi:hypothetical protein